MNIAFCFNRALVKYAYVLIYSIIKNHPNQKIDFYIFHDGSVSDLLAPLMDLCSEYIDIHELIIENDDLLLLRGLVQKKRLPVEAYFRILLPQYLPKDIDRVLYMDIDIVVDGSILEFYNSDMKDYPLGAFFWPLITEKQSLEIARKITEGAYIYDLKRVYCGQYFQSGLLLFNLNIWRENKYDAHFFVEKNAEFMPHRIGSREDQALLNYTFYNQTLYFNRSDFLVNGLSQSIDRPAIVHFSGKWNPWKFCIYEETAKMLKKAGMTTIYIINLAKYSPIWWQYAKETPFYDELLSNALNTTTGFLTKLMTDRVIADQKRMNHLLSTQIDSNVLLSQDAKRLIPMFFTDKGVWKTPAYDKKTSSQLVVLNTYEPRKLGRVLIPFRQAAKNTKIKIVLDIEVCSTSNKLQFHLGNYNRADLVKQRIYDSPMPNNEWTKIEIETVLDDDYNCVFFTQRCFKTPGDWIRLFSASVVALNDGV